MTTPSDVRTGVQPLGLRYAETDAWRVLAYADGGYATMYRQPKWRCWYLCGDECTMPADVERALCAALGIEYGRTDR